MPGDIQQRVQRIVRETIRRHDLIQPGALVVGVSGGADSMVLLRLLCDWQDELGLRPHVATLDHELRGGAGAADAAFVRETATAWGVPVTVGRADVRAVAESTGLGTEAAARGVRYRFLRDVARQIDASQVAVGHHLDDQAETVLLHLIRGSGLEGLRGMLPRTPLSRGHVLDDVEIEYDRLLNGEPYAPDIWPDVWPEIVRPLLAVSRADIEAFAAARELDYRQDTTNTDVTYLRNRLRHEVIPLLEQLNPNIRATLARTAEVLRADADLVAATSALALAQVVR
ncbi:MAG: tRNA lysidine(34) synthetase TilS, partial [Chloroflexi bacterium]|nr:tRNA lysidine(34) synthetase TilS [Chloroflexota bacterium]